MPGLEDMLALDAIQLVNFFCIASSRNNRDLMFDDSRLIPVHIFHFNVNL